jgi:hypothetical protein
MGVATSAAWAMSAVKTSNPKRLHPASEALAVWTGILNYLRATENTAI